MGTVLVFDAGRAAPLLAFFSNGELLSRMSRRMEEVTWNITPRTLSSSTRGTTTVYMMLLFHSQLIIMIISFVDFIIDQR